MPVEQLAFECGEEVPHSASYASPTLPIRRTPLSLEWDPVSTKPGGHFKRQRGVIRRYRTRVHCAEVEFLFGSDAREIWYRWFLVILELRAAKRSPTLRTVPGFGRQVKS